MKIDEMIALLEQKRNQAELQAMQMAALLRDGMDYNLAMMDESAGNMKRGLGMLMRDYNGMAAEGNEQAALARGKQRRYLEGRARRRGEDPTFASVENTGPKGRIPIGRPKGPVEIAKPDQTYSSGAVPPEWSPTRGGLSDFLLPEAREEKTRS